MRVCACVCWCCPHSEGEINLLEFAEIIRDLQVFEQFDMDRSGFISTAELRVALGKLGAHMSHPQTELLLRKYDTDNSGYIEFPEFRKLAEDLPSLVGRSNDSFFRMHHGESAYVHAEDVLDEELHVDLDQTFTKKSSTKKRSADGDSSKKKAGAHAVLGLAGSDPKSVLAAPASVLSSAHAQMELAPPAASNPFNSRLYSPPPVALPCRPGGAGVAASGNIRAVRLVGSEKPSLQMPSRSRLQP